MISTFSKSAICPGKRWGQVRTGPDKSGFCPMVVEMAFCTLVWQLCHRFCEHVNYMLLQTLWSRNQAKFTILVVAIVILGMMNGTHLLWKDIFILCDFSDFVDFTELMTLPMMKRHREQDVMNIAEESTNWKGFKRFTIKKEHNRTMLRAKNVRSFERVSVLQWLRHILHLKDACQCSAGVLCSLHGQGVIGPFFF